MPIDPAFARPGTFFKGNLHTHSTLSDGARAPRDVCNTYRDAGYDFLALTDHFLPAYGFPIADTRAFRTSSFTTILGAEVHAMGTALGELWHVLAVGLPSDFAPATPDETGPALATRCRAAGAFTAIAHPAWYGLTAEDADTIADAHAVEIYNHTSAVRTDRGDSTPFVDHLLAHGRRFSICATDDAHFHCQDAFGGFVLVKATANEPDALLDALKASAFYSSQGPAIHAVEYGSDSVEVVCSPAAAVIALGRGSAAVPEVGAGITRARLPLEPLRAGGYARIVVIDAVGRRAWTNPVWW